MSNYFSKFPKVLYQFGDNEQPVLFQKLTKYSDFIDVARNDIATYTELEIVDGERPDTLSYKLYGNPNYDWTFFLMNERLRETGWPMTVQEVYEAAQNSYFPNYVAKLAISTADSAAEFADIYPIGQSVLVNNQAGTVIAKNLDVGEITIQADSDISGETLLRYDDTTNAKACLVVYEYEGTHHYENDSGEWSDLYFSAEIKTPITNLEHLVAQNDASKRIAVIKRDFINQAVGEVKRQIENE